MPEIPEVEAFKYYIKSHCLKETIENVLAADTRVIKKISFSNFKKDLIGAHFVSVERKGKYLVIAIKPSDKKLVMHFGLTGFVVVANADEKVKYETVSFIFKKEKLAWCTIRKFAKLWLVNTIDQIPSLKDLGPDPLTLTAAEFISLLESNKNKNIKTFLMDQSDISGIGNEYSDEILFQAGIDPRHHIKDLSHKQMQKMYVQMKKVLKYAIALRKKNVTKLVQGPIFSAAGSTMFKSSYLQAHRHTDMLCPKNKHHTLKKITIGGRSAYFCPVDQK